MAGSCLRGAEMIRSMFQLRIVGYIALFVADFYMPRAAATSVGAIQWEELVAGSTFLGIVECTTAGGLVAKYKVIESWKGVPVGARISIREEPDIHGPKFPFALCGEQYLIAAYRSRPWDMRGVRSMPINMADPVWWRELPSDFTTPLFRGRYRLKPHAGIDLRSAFGSPHESLEEFREVALELLELSGDRQEEQVLRALIAQRNSRQRIPDGPADERSSGRQGYSAASPRQVVDGLVTVLPDYPKGNGYAVADILQRGGGLLTLSALDKFKSTKSPELRMICDLIAHSIRFRLDLPDPTPLPTQLDSPAFQDWPAFSADALMERYSDLLVETDESYKAGFAFASRLKENREEQFTMMLSARDPFIRVTGAVYLCYENKSLGMLKLRDVLELDGDAGVWAALNLARRGDKAAVERALEVFAQEDDRGREGQLHERLQERLIVLLSNTAAHSGIPQPERAEAKEGRRKIGSPELHAKYLKWWRTHATQAVLFDPWLELLEEQKID